MFRISQSVAVFNAEFIVTYVVQEHIDTTKIISCNVDFLTEKSIANIVFAENFCKLQKQ